MTIIATDILGDLCGLSLGLLIAIIPVGLLLWLLGWWSHRFWIVLTTTVLAGVFGLLEASSWRVQPIVVAVLLAIAAGVLALALVRVVTFAAGGLASIYVVQYTFPTWNQPVICFLVGGLLSLLLFRWCFMALTSFLGTTLLGYGILALLHYHEALDALGWAETNASFLTILCGLFTFTGFAFQIMFERWRKRRDLDEEEEEDGFTSMILGRIGFGGKASKAA
jgi:hypothetical protein